MKKLDFATTLSETQSYIGEAALPYVTAAFMKNKTVDSGIKTVEDIVKFSLYLHKNLYHFLSNLKCLYQIF